MMPTPTPITAAKERSIQRWIRDRERRERTHRKREKEKRKKTKTERQKEARQREREREILPSLISALMYVTLSQITGKKRILRIEPDAEKTQSDEREYCS